MAGTTLLGTLVVALGSESKDFTRGMDAAGIKTKQASAEMAKASVVALGLSAAIIGIGVAATKLAGGFETQMIRVGAISKATADEFRLLEATARNLGATTQFTATQAAEGMTFLAQAGFSVEENVGAMEGVLQLATAAQLDLATASDIAASTLRGMGLEIADIGRVNDVLVTAMTSANTNVQQLGAAFKFVGPVAKSAGVAFEEIAAGVSLMSNAGIQGEMAGTAMRGAIAKLLNPSKEASAVLSELGITAVDSSGKLMPFSGIIRDLGAAGITTGQIFEVFGQRAGPGVAALIEVGADALDGFTKKLRESGGAAADIQKKQLNSLEGQLDILKSQFESLALDIGKILMPAFRQMVATVQEAVKWFQDMTDEQKNSIVEMGAMAAGALAAVGTVGGLIVALGALKIALAVVGIAFSTAFGPVGLVIAAVGAAIALLILDVGKLEVALTDLSPEEGARKQRAAEAKAAEESRLEKESRGGSVDLFSGRLDAQQKKKDDAASVAAKKAARAIKELEREAAKAAEELGVEFGEFFGVLDSGKLQVESFGDGFEGAMADIRGAVKSTNKNLVLVGRDMAKALAPKLIAEKIEEMGDAFGDAARTVEVGADGLAAPFMDLAARLGSETVVGAAEAGIRALREKSKKTAKTVGKAMEFAAQTLGNAFLQGSQTLGSVFGAAVEGFSKGGVFGAIIGAFAALLSETKSFAAIIANVEAFLQRIVSRLEPIVEPFVALFDAILETMELVSILGDSIGNLTGGFEVFGFLIEGLAKVVGWINGAIETAVNAILEGLAKLVGVFSDKLAKKIRNAKIDLDQVDRRGSGDGASRERAAPRGMTDAMETVADSVNDFGDALKEATGELLNIPTGLKIAAARFAASDPALAASVGGLPGPGSVVGTGSMTINIENFTAENPAEFLDTMRRESEFQQFRDTGSTMGGPEFGNSRAGTR